VTSTVRFPPERRMSNDADDRRVPPPGGLASEFRAFLREHKLWWLTPIVVFVALVGFLLVRGDASSSLFIYTLF